MAKIKYHFDSETLSYVPVESSRTVKISRLLIFFISSFLFGGIILFVLLNTSIVNTPQELLLKERWKIINFNLNLLIDV